MSAISISRRFIQTSDVDSFNGNPETSRTPPLLQAAPVFDSSMALTILVLLTALFFLAFFSIYIRRFATATATAAVPPHRKCGGGGLDSSAVDSLPLVPYGGAAKHRMIEECPICLGEFSETETVKMIPYCGHVFHPSCLDTWLAAHVTCPLCRSAELFRPNDEICLDVSSIGVTVRRASSCSHLANPTSFRRTASF
ncbi:RING-H2 finger protein ATL57-like [Salvia hispanica]|uniref:RING-H2 finger protein ATL57-like n=1 Tax=Salvia hispanica TaxID=49212 RepID=UPI00200924B0|nr:RING-H2 finger protein ATL57-like [Salvia hispanica]